LVKAQKEFAPALKTSLNPHFKSKYVGLDGCVEAVIDALNNNGIYLLQKSHDCDDGVKVETVLVHESGEQISGGVLHVPAAKNDPQGYGSALTYARRYSLMATCGIAPEDDDGNQATSSYRNQPKVEPKAQESQPMAMYTVTPEQDLKCKEIAADVVDFATKLQWDDAFITFDNVTDHDERICVWTHLKANSPVRTKLKQMGDAKQQALKNGSAVITSIE